MIAASSSSSSCNPPDTVGGPITINPQTGGTPFVTNFLLNISGCLDPNGGSLSYAVVYIKPAPYSSDPAQISDFSPNSTYSFCLPLISSATIWVTIKDQYGCLTNVSTHVTLAVSGTTSRIDLLQEAANLPSSFLTSGSQADLNALINQIATANQLLTCGTTSSASCNSSSVTVCMPICF